MEALVYKYLNKNYVMTQSNYLSGVVTDRDTNKNLTIVDLYQAIDKVFSIGTRIADSIVTKWWDQQELPYIEQELSQSARRYI